MISDDTDALIAVSTVAVTGAASTIADISGATTAASAAVASAAASAAAGAGNPRSGSDISALPADPVRNGFA